MGATEIIIDGRFTDKPVETRSIMTNYNISKHYCPFCKVEIIRPRKQYSDRSMFEYKDTFGEVDIKYNHYMCPECKIILFYGD